MIGQMTEIVELFALSEVTDELGGRTETSTSLGEFFAKVEYKSGSVKEQSGREGRLNTVIFLLHNFSDLDLFQSDFILYNGQTFEVVAKKFEGAQKLFISFECLEGDAHEQT